MSRHFILCQHTGRLVDQRGNCAVHAGDACLKVYAPVEAAEASATDLRGSLSDLLNILEADKLLKHVTLPSHFQKIHAAYRLAGR